MTCDHPTTLTRVDGEKICMVCNEILALPVETPLWITLLIYAYWGSVAFALYTVAFIAKPYRHEGDPNVYQFTIFIVSFIPILNILSAISTIKNP